MKKLGLLLLIAGVVACKNGNTGNKPADNGQINASWVNNPRTADGMDTVAAARKPTMDFTDTVHDFGKIKQDEVVSYEFTFHNNGKTPLLISGATGSCGCTVPAYPHDPIAPGGSGVMKVTFNSASKSGPQNKTVTITTNALRSIHMLYIKAEVIAPKEGSH
jgi:hypothetical protein